MENDEREIEKIVELVVRRILSESEAERGKAILESLNSQRDFMIGNTKWAVTGFFGLIVLFGAIGTFLFGTQVDTKVIEYFVNPKIASAIDARILSSGNEVANRKIEELKISIYNEADAQAQESISRVRNAVRQEADLIIDEAVKKSIVEAQREFTSESTDEIIQRLFPRGAVVAFDRVDPNRDIGGACPEGWQLFEPAGGRMILGAGRHQNADAKGTPLSNYPAYADSPERSIGGSETHTLNVAEMPSHTHRISYGGADTAVDIAGLNTGVNWGIRRTISSDSTSATGDGQPHNNMPPFIALYFCKKG